ncbi:nucleotide exchange factor GrpE [bacterium]|nr:nucleotide exchange factor GrpE [bacterium]
MSENPNNSQRSAENGGESAEQKVGIEEPVIEEVPTGKRDDDKLVRLMADFENFRRRSAKEILQERQKGRREAATKLLPVLDALDNALLSMPADSPYRSGIEGLRAQFIASYETLGFEKVPTAGAPFDPEVHEAIAHLPHGTHAEGIVIQESRAGFRDEVGLVRAAQVVVSSGSGS